MRLDELPIDCAARVVEVIANTSVMLRLMEMGLVRGAAVRVRKRAPFGGPLELQVGAYLLSIRREEAKRLQVQPEQSIGPDAGRR
jgi:ferrous iron transport protein A